MSVLVMPMARHHVHLSDVETARRAGRRRGRPVILGVDAARLVAADEPFFLASHGVCLIGRVPPDVLTQHPAGADAGSAAAADGKTPDPA